jgi:Flp pilus assembly pilin Flp
MSGEASVVLCDLAKERGHMKALLKKLVREEAGQDLIEYGLLVGLITAAAVLTITNLGPRIVGYYETLCSRLGFGATC